MVLYVSDEYRADSTTVQWAVSVILALFLVSCKFLTRMPWSVSQESYRPRERVKMASFKVFLERSFVCFLCLLLFVASDGIYIYEIDKATVLFLRTGTWCIFSAQGNGYEYSNQNNIWILYTRQIQLSSSYMSSSACFLSCMDLSRTLSWSHRNAE